jgi:hypothetical protein
MCTMLLGFLGGMATMLFASIASGFVLGYFVSQFQVGPHAPWVPIDKNIGLESAIYGIIAGNLLATAGLVWFSSRRRNWMPLWGGVAVFAAELTLLFTAREHPLVEFGTLILASVAGFFAFGVFIAVVCHQLPSSTGRVMNPTRRQTCEWHWASSLAC